VICLLADDWPLTQGIGRQRLRRHFHQSCHRFNATVVDQLEAAGAIVAGKTNLDEFGMGSNSTNSRRGFLTGPKCELVEFDPIPNSSKFVFPATMAPAASSCVSGQSSARRQITDFYSSLGTDTGGSVRLPAAYTGTHW
jgi:aspartyl-tRNA(Asn)/glutamyl-tRNA(Gln) amidotransferase subunit A